jgi:hypothetical protein
MVEFAKRQRNGDGVPLPETTVPIRKEEAEQAKTVCTGVRARTFLMNKPEDVAEYEKVMHGMVECANIRIGRDLEQWVPEQQTFMILVRWAEIQGKIPQHLLDMESRYD